MGLDATSLKWLCQTPYQRPARLLTLGRQQWFGSSREPGRWFPQPPGSSGEFVTDATWEWAGFCQVDSLDRFSSEGATRVVDLHQAQLREEFNVVFDGGTLEHTFVPTQVLENVARGLVLDGWYVASVPADNYCGHGFYQFSPCFFFAALGALGFADVEVALVNDATGRMTTCSPTGTRTRHRSWFRHTLLVRGRKARTVDSIGFPAQPDFAGASSTRWKQGLSEIFPKTVRLLQGLVVSR